MIWYDMIWYDMIWCDMIWHDMTWYDMIWHDMIWHNMTWCDVTWHDMTWHDMTWHDMTWHDMTWHDTTWHDVMWNPLRQCRPLLKGPYAAIYYCRGRAELLSWLSRSIWSHLLAAKSSRDKEYELPSITLAPISTHAPDNKRLREGLSHHTDSLSLSSSVSIELSTSSTIEKFKGTCSNTGQGGRVQQRGQILDLDSRPYIPTQHLNDAQPKMKTCKSKAAMMEAKRIKTAQVIAVQVGFQ